MTNQVYAQPVRETPKRYTEDGSGWFVVAEQFPGYYFLHCFISPEDAQEFIDDPNSGSQYSKIVHPKSVRGHRKSPIYH